MVSSDKNRFEKIVKIGIVIMMLSVTVPTVLGVAFYFYFTHDLPRIEALKNYRPSTLTKVYSEEGEVIGEYFYEKREVVPLERLPSHLIHAFIAGEDSRFFQHKGLDYQAILRAFYRNIFSEKIIQGGSTITQQVVKSLLLSNEKSFSRKIREAILAFKIEKYLTKDEILLLYLNQIYLGHGAYGVAAAAENYFGKTVEELDLAESALLAGLTQAPSKSSPYQYPEQAKKRQIYVLNRMVEEGFISAPEAMRAAQAPYVVRSKEKPSLEKASYFVEAVRHKIEEKYGKEALYKNGLQVFTTIDLQDQKIAQEAMEAGLREIEKRQKYSAENIPVTPEGALICFDLETGYVKAMVGGRDFKKSQFNRATQARRQTGSAFKPIVYASALDKGFTPASIIVDSPVVFINQGKKWKPRNFKGTYSGPTTFRNGLTHSVNTVTVKIAQEVGVDYIRDFAQKLGIFSPLDDNLAMSLGSSSLSLDELTRAYAVFANQGKAFQPILIKKILDRDGNLLEENLPIFYSPSPSGEEQILTPQTAFLITYLLEGVVQHGTGWRARSLSRPVAGKTGTTDQFIDAWFIGYTPEWVTGVWVGFDEERSLGNNETGERAASPIWVNFMSQISKDRPVKEFPVPDDVEFTKINPKTGQASTEGDGLLECFKEGTSPKADVPSSVKTSTDFFKLDFNSSTKPN